ncbi:MAG: hypothetical protein M3Q99_02265 [Acidobacteriota bacterium]|nr:hypothetical protein [Acidobacteriota bacterium]
MKKWLTSLFLFFSLASGALAGTPAFSGNAENGMSAMECCKKKTKDCGAKSVSAAQLCCAVNCNNPAPTAPGASFNFSPSSVVISDSILKQIALLFAQEKPVQTDFHPFERKTLPQNFQPKYIQNHSFLI